MKTETTTPGTTTQSTTTTHSTTPPKTPPGGKVVLITGGSSYHPAEGNATSHSAEIFLPNSPNEPCILHDLPAPYSGHTQDGGMICGGRGQRGSLNNNCRQWNQEEGKFPINPVHEFNPARGSLVSWTPMSEMETFLIGGDGPSESFNSSTIVKPGVFDGYKGFYLKYYLYGSCAVADPETDTVVIIGGNTDSYKVTSLYNEDGWVEDFGNLHYMRWRHGCTSYVANKKRVTNYCF